MSMGFSDFQICRDHIVARFARSIDLLSLTVLHNHGGCLGNGND
jgi:hypothetical protein